MPRIALVACAVLERELSLEISQTDSAVRVWWLNQGLHDTPDLLRQTLQAEIDRIEKEQENFSRDKKYDAICIGYGLCSNGVIGLRAGTLPLVIPRCDDCISLFLGSANRYRDLFAAHPGAYWYNPGWIEHAFTPSEQSYAARFADYIDRYGEDNAEYLMAEERDWVKNYRSCIFIDSPVYQNKSYEDYAEEAAEAYGWQFSHEQGNQYLLTRLLAGEWNDTEFLICPAGNMVEAEYSDRKIRAAAQE